MGLACSQVRFLTLTQRKADLEYGLSVDSIEKMALSREQTELAREYNSKLQAKNVSFYANGKFNQINYNYLMGNGADWNSIIKTPELLKTNNSTVLCDFKGQVVLSKSYANAICSVLGTDMMDSNGRGKTFSKESIPEILGQLLPGIDKEAVQTVINEENISSSYSATGEKSGNSVEVDNTSKMTSDIKKIVDFYYPIFTAAASNGWTTEYNNEMEHNTSYVSDALNSGTFQLESVDENGNYDPDTSLSYFLMHDSNLDARTDSDQRQEITAWYEEEKARIKEKEDFLDLDIENLSTELEAVKTEMESVKSFIDNAIESVFDWGSG